MALDIRNNARETNSAAWSDLSASTPANPNFDPTKLDLHQYTAEEWEIVRRFIFIQGGARLPANPAFQDGFTSGYVEYWHKSGHRGVEITGDIITQFIQEHSHHSDGSADWNAGYITGWLLSILNPAETALVTAPEVERACQTHAG